MTRFHLSRNALTAATAIAALVFAGAIAHAGRPAAQATNVAYSVAPDAPRAPTAPKAPDVLPGVTPASDAPATDEPIPQG